MKKVVLVLGAGSSCTYGAESKLPTAQGLKERIISQTTLSDRALGNFERGHDFAKSDAEAVKAQFAASGHYSIDRFLELQTQHLEIGRQLIAAALLPLEAAAIKDRSIASGWYQWLFNQLLSTKSKSLRTQGLTIVTFNYDRTLEFALATMLINSLGLSPDTAEGAVASIPIYHVYGKLASRVRYNQEKRQFEVDAPQAFIRNSAESIRIVSNDRDEAKDDALQRSVAAVRAADVVVFLGFGFDKTNIRRLGIDRGADVKFSVMRNVQVVGSAFGLCNRERMAVTDLLKNSNLEGATVALGAADMGCEAFLREYVDLREYLGVDE